MKQKIRISSHSQYIDSQAHERVVAQGTDVPEQPPSVPLALQEVGISGKTVWVRLPEGYLPFDARITVDLPAQVRGIHMSRIEQAIAQLYPCPHVRLSDYALELACDVLGRQRGTTARVALAGKRPLLRSSQISGQLSVDPLSCRVEAVARLRPDGEIETELTNGIGVSHITACPCTQVYNRDLFSERGACPMPTHSQRSITWLLLRGTPPLPGHEELLSCLEDALHLTQDLLKRPDEAEIVLKSHMAPQFAEDAVRETARAVARRFRTAPDPRTEVIIESLSLESIHIHDVCCRLTTTLRELNALADL